MSLRRLIGVAVLAAGLAILVPAQAGTRGADQLFWVPNMEQALAMARATKRPIFMMAYTCVGETSETFSGQSTVW